mgnify:CR=1 FL=1
MIKTSTIIVALFIFAVIVGGLIVINQSKTPRTDATVFPLEGIKVAISLQDFTVNKTFDYDFSDHPIESIYDGPIAELDTKSSELAGIFRTRIRNQLKEGVNFAGHYSIMMAGCGTECQMIAITDVITGKVVVETSSRADIGYTENSKLLIIDNDEMCLSTDICMPSYYVLQSGTLIKLD